MQHLHFERDALKGLAKDLLISGGMANELAEVVAEFLTRTDEMGVTTHGISMVPYYIPELENGTMTASGCHEVVRDNSVTMVWDGHYLPGHWLMAKAIDTCIDRAATFGVAAVAIRRSHHIGCLSTLTQMAAEQGYICYIATSDPSGKWVAPFGGIEPLLTPNPWAVGYPAAGHPVLIDTCASITTVSKVREHINKGTQFDHQWMLDADGKATTDPSVVNQTPRGSILPVGGKDHGHKGFAMGLMVEMLTQALSGHGRANAPVRWGGNVFLQIICPDAFAGREDFLCQVDTLNTACRSCSPVPGGDAVRIPGDRAYDALSNSQKEGVRLPDEVWARVTAAAAKFDLPLPEPIGIRSPEMPVR
ncbi:Ldh family oxidoreductase [Roseibium sediminis]|uniref:Ldh family oxidoreductase n=1 Tax=Roseibium sediminis TaxID=1775174 RepID=UPI00123E0A27|nr:Ldh family oxidoreductase [Roseibium sediminis]